MDENQTVNLHFQKFDKSYPVKDTGVSLQVNENKALNSRKMAENFEHEKKKEKVSKLNEVTV